MGELSEETRELRAHRARVRAAIEGLAEHQEVPGVVTAWIVIAEVASYDEGEPCKTILMDHAYHDDTALVPWMLNGLLDHASEALNRPAFIVSGGE